MHRFRLLSLLACLLLLASCGTSGRLGDDDDNGDDDDSGISGDDDDATGDDDDATGDDDDATGDDDDATGDDDDATGDDDDATGDDDDDDATGDDDDSTPIGPPPDDPLGMVNETYCLDWNTVNIIEPPGLATILSTVAGIQIEDYPLLVEPTAVDTAAGSIDMLMTGALEGTCTQDLSISTVDLTNQVPGVYTPPLFVVGPGDFSTNISSFQLTIFDLIVSGQFTQDHQQIVQAEFTGDIDITAYASQACWLLTCFPCVSNPNLDCVSFHADSATFDITANGPLTPVP